MANKDLKNFLFVDNILVVQMNNKSSEEEFRNPHYLLLNIAMGAVLVALFQTILMKTLWR